MVPFDEDPVAMDIGGGTYPKAGADGTFKYQKTVSLKALDAAFAKAFGDKELDLDRRVVFVHGILAVHRAPRFRRLARDGSRTGHVAHRLR